MSDEWGAINSSTNESYDENGEYPEEYGSRLFDDIDDEDDEDDFRY